MSACGHWPELKDADGGVCVGVEGVVDENELISGREAILEGG